MRERSARMRPVDRLRVPDSTCWQDCSCGERFVPLELEGPRAGPARVAMTARGTWD